MVALGCYSPWSTGRIMHAAKHMCMLQHACKASNMLYNVFKLAFHASMQSIMDAIYIYIERERERDREIYT